MKPDTFSPDYIPAHAIQCWTDDTYVYTAVPVRNGPPLIQRYPLTEGGLTKALDFLKAQNKEKANYYMPRQSFRKDQSYSSTPAQRERARLALLKVGIR